MWKMEIKKNITQKQGNDKYNWTSSVDSHDLFGPVNVLSLSRKKYALVMVDDFSKYTWVLFLQSKDEAP